MVFIIIQMDIFGMFEFGNQRLLNKRATKKVSKIEFLELLLLLLLTEAVT